MDMGPPQSYLCIHFKTKKKNIIKGIVKGKESSSTGSPLSKGHKA